MSTHTSMTDWIADFKGRPRNAPGKSLIEMLPTELLQKIAGFAMDPLPPTYPKDSLSMRDTLPQQPSTKKKTPKIHGFLLSSRRLYDITLPVLYNSPVFPSPTAFVKFSRTMEQNSELRNLVKSFSLGSGKTGMKKAYDDCWKSLPNLRKLDLQIRNEGDIACLRSNLHRLPTIDAIFLERSFNLSEDSSIMEDSHFGSLPPSPYANIRTFSYTLNLSETLARDLQYDYNAEFLSRILPALPGLRNLSICVSRISDALKWLHPAVKLQSLVIKMHGTIDSEPMDYFLETHPAVASLEQFWLTTYNENSSENSINRLLRWLPSTLKSLRMPSLPPLESEWDERIKTIPDWYYTLSKLVPNLEELSLGMSSLHPKDLEPLLMGPCFNITPLNLVEMTRTHLNAAQRDFDAFTSLERNNIYQSVSISVLGARIKAMSPKDENNPSLPKLRYLDLKNCQSVGCKQIKLSVLLARESGLQIIELPRMTEDDRQQVHGVAAVHGWKLRHHETRQTSRTWLDRR